MPAPFQVGDRVITIAALPAIPLGTLGTVVGVFHVLFNVCHVQFDGYPTVHMTVVDTLARAPIARP